MNGSWKGLALAAAVAATSPAWATAQEREVERTTRQTTVERGSVNRITTLMKSEVTLQEGEPAGHIVDFVVSDRGCIEYLVAEHDDGYYLVPYAAARVDFRAHTVRLTVTQREFRDVIVFKNSDWPNLSDRAYQQRLNKFWGVQAARGTNTLEERTTNKPIPREGNRNRDDDRDRNRDRDRDRDRDRNRDDDRRPDTRGDNPPRDPKSPPARDPKSPKTTPPAAPGTQPGAQPRDPAPRPNPDAGPKTRPRTEVPPKPPAPSGNTGNEESKKPRNEKP